MARGRPARSRARGGEVVPSLRPTRARLSTGLGAIATLGAVTAYIAFAGGRFAPVGETVAGAGTVVLAAGIAIRLAAAVPWSVGLAGAGYVVAREHHAVVDGWATAVGAALLLAAELAAWSIDDDRRIREERALVVRRVTTLVALVGASALVGFVLIGRLR
jgi:hypothetical protein